MANILEFLRGVLVDPEAQQVFHADAEGFVTRAGFADMTGEDVVEAVAVLRRSLPPEVAGPLGDFDDEARIPSVRPGFGERDLDAALRLLGHAVDLATGTIAPAPVAPGSAPSPFWETSPAAVGPFTAPPLAAEDASPWEAPAHHEPIDAEADAELTEPEPAAAPAAAPHHPPSPAHDEPIAVDAGPELATPIPAPVDLSGLPAVEALGAAISAAATEVREVLGRYAEDVRDQLAAALTEAERDAARMRAEADADRDAARQVLAEAHREAEALRAEAQRGHEELTARLEELRAAERALRSVLRDD